MEVKCERCLTVYEFEDAKVGPQGVTVKCSQCGHLFKVKRRQTAEYAAVNGAITGYGPGEPRTTAPGTPSLQDAVVAAPPGMSLRRALTGEIIPVPDLAVLQ